MTEEIQMALDTARSGMEKSIAHMESELMKIRAGKAHPAMLDSVMVEYYGTMTPLSQVSNINSTDAKRLPLPRRIHRYHSDRHPSPWSKRWRNPSQNAGDSHRRHKTPPLHAVLS